ncbi:MAG: hypothetical protein IT434_18415, partial [Phycisphaerales bacterium]|nr:hypothetical protein [Phycisphaerales bacterium]
MPRDSSLNRWTWAPCGATGPDAKRLCMYVSLLFWVALLLPGYAVARLIDEDDAECGLLGLIGLSYFWACALLAPVSILCYVLQLPVAVFSVACLVAIVGGIIVIHRRKWWKPIRMLLIAGVAFELAIVAVDVACSLRRGSFLSGDAEMHVGRIRFLLTHGFSNQGPYLNIPTFFRLYHTNLQHALYAACSQVTATDYLDVWYVSLAWAKLVVAGGVNYLAWRVLGSKQAAWLPTLFGLATNAPVPYITYPNQLAPLWLLPLGLGVAMEFLHGRVRPGVPWKLAAISFVIGQTHGLYAVFLGMVLAPIFAVVIIARMVRREATGWARWACLAALLAGAPFLLVTRYWGDVTPPDADARNQITRDVREQNESFHTLPHDRVVLKAEKLFADHPAIRLGFIVAGLVGLYALGRRREALALGGIVAVVLALLLVPILCTLLIKILGERWIALRLLTVLISVLAISAGGAIALAVERLKPRWWVRVPVACGVIALAIGPIWNRAEYSWREYVQDTLKPAEERHAWLRYLRRQRAFLVENVDPGSIVLAHPRDGRMVVMLCNCYVVLPDRAAGMSPSIPLRRADLMMMLDPNTPWPERRDMLRHYGVTRIYKSDLLKDYLGWTK